MRDVGLIFFPREIRRQLRHKQPSSEGGHGLAGFAKSFDVKFDAFAHGFFDFIPPQQAFEACLLQDTLQCTSPDVVIAMAGHSYTLGE